MSALITELSKLDSWLLARCIIGVRPDPAHLRHASSAVGRLLQYLDGISYRDRELIARQQLSPDMFSRVVGVDPEAACPVDSEDRNWLIIPAAQLKNLPSVTWLVKGEIPERGLVVLYGQSGAGKSFLSLDYALRLAQDMTVVYIAAEGEWGYARRVEAWCKHHGLTEGQLFMCLGAVNLREQSDYEAFFRQLALLQPRLVVVDTLAMSMVGGDENSSKDMGLVIQTCKRIIREYDSSVLIVHHVNKGGIAERGSGTLRAAADIMIKVNPYDDVIAVENSKSKDVSPFPTRYIRLLPVELGSTGDGETAESVVVVPADDVVLRDDDHLTNNQTRLIEALAMDTFATGATFAELIEVVEMNKGTVYRVLSRLMQLGYVEKGSGVYKLTEKGRLVAAVAVVAPATSTTSGDSGGAQSQPVQPAQPAQPVLIEVPANGRKPVNQYELGK